MQDIDASAEVRSATIAPEWHGQRLDKVLLALAGEFSRSHLQQLIRDGLVQLDGRSITKPAHKVTVGQGIAITLQATAQSQAFVPQPMALPIVFEDEAMLVIDKPAGLVVHPAAGNWSGTLLNGLLAHDSALAQLPRAGIVHRLDKDTSGLMVVAKTMPAHTALVERIAARAVSRQYIAVAARRARAASTRETATTDATKEMAAMAPWRALGEVISVDAAIGRDAHNRLRMAVVEGGAGKPAQTEIRLLASRSRAERATLADAADAPNATNTANTSNTHKAPDAHPPLDYALLHCRLHTGRTHQIRVHARYLGWPLVGDATYGGAAHPAMARQALHAWHLGLDHPISNTPMHWHSPLPADMQALLQALDLPFPQEIINQ